MQFLRVFRRKSRRFIPAELFFLVLYIISYQSALILKKLPCRKKFRVTRRETQMFSCKFYEISKNTFFYRTPLQDCFWIFQQITVNTNQIYQLDSLKICFKLL